MSFIIYLPTPDELAVNLNKVQNDKDYKKNMKELAASIIDYSQQIEDLMGESVPITIQEDEDIYGDKL
jgi:hypothetical protein